MNTSGPNANYPWMIEKSLYMIWYLKPVALDMLEGFPRPLTLCHVLPHDMACMITLPPFLHPLMIAVVACC